MGRNNGTRAVDVRAIEVLESRLFLSAAQAKGGPAAPVGPVTGTSSAGETFTLRDDGLTPDEVAGDGIFTANWAPTRAFTFIDFASAAGSERISADDVAVTAVSGPTSANRGSVVALSATVANLGSSAAETDIPKRLTGRV